MKTEMSTFSPVAENINQLTSNPSQYVESPPNLLNGFVKAAKVIHHDIVKSNPLTRLKTRSLPQLHVEGFDEEQIWQQLELQNKFATSHFSNLSNSILQKNPDTVSIGSTTQHGDDVSDSGSLSDEYQDPPADRGSEESDDEDFNMDESDSDENSKQPKSILKKSAASKKVEEDECSESEGDVHLEESGNSECELTNQPKSILKKSVAKSKELEDDGNEESESVQKITWAKELKSHETEKSPKQRKYPSSVDDQFFKLAKLEKFLRLEDLKEERARDGDLMEEKDSDEEELTDDEDIDLFQDIPSDELDEDNSSEEEDISKTKSSREVMYGDFFDAPDDESEDENEFIDQDQNSMENEEPMDLSNDDESKDDTPELTAPAKVVPKTPFELEQEKIKEQIEDYEEKMLEPAAWHLTGEVDSTKRPKDALLHLQTDFDMNAKPVVVQDKPLCEKLESMLKNTIKNKAFSDGVRQYKTNDEVIKQKKEVFIADTKSKKGLAEEYEDMYLKKKHGEQEEENPKHKEIKKLMDSLFPELHALFTHIPKPAIPDIKVVSNLPAISVEDVAPTSVSDVTLLAPEEVKKRTGVIKGKTERTDVDRKRERRKKKLLQKMKQKKREKENGEKPLSAKAQKQEKLDLVKKLKQQRNTKFAKVDGQKVKSSKDFFERLQETVGKTGNKKKSKS